LRNKLLATLVIAWITVVGLALTDPTFVTEHDIHINGTILALINIAGFSIIGFLLSTVLPDFYMDEEYRSVNQSTARAIHTLGLCLIFAAALNAFT